MATAINESSAAPSRRIPVAILSFLLVFIVLMTIALFNAPTMGGPRVMATVNTYLAEVRRTLVEIGAAGGPCFFLADMHGCTSIDAEARKYLSEWSKTGIEKPTAVAAYGIDFAMRALITLTLTAIKFLGLRRIEVALLKDAAEMEAWLTDRRAALARAAQG